VSSILSQTYKDYEIIIVNDASTDSTLDVITKLSNISDKIRIISNTTNIGPDLSRKIGIENANGEFIMRIDSDDYLCGTNLISNIMPYFIDDVDIVSFPYKAEKRKVSYYANRVFEITNNKDSCIKIDDFTCLCNKVFRKTLFELPNLFTAFDTQEDVLLYVKLISFSKTIVYLPNNDVEYYYYTNNKSSLTNTISTLKRNAYKLLNSFLIHIFLRDHNFFRYFPIYGSKEYIDNCLKEFENIKNDIKAEYSNLYYKIIENVKEL
jgi:glycosyltransferase involved in cell wall biosynthesis